MLDCGEPGPINLGNPVELAVRDIAELVRQSVGSLSEIQLHPLPEDDPTRRRPDITLAEIRDELRQQRADFLVIVDDEEMLSHARLSRPRAIRGSRFL